MEFYSYEYLKNQLAVIDYVQLALSAIVVIILAVALFKYYRNKQDTKYRELALIAFIFILIQIGTRINELQATQINENQNAGAVHLIEVIADKLGVERDSIYINAQAAKDGAIVKIDNQFYRVIISDKPDQFILERMSVKDPEVTLKEAE